MKDLSLVLLLFVAAFLTAGRAVAQDSLSIRDASEIRYKAERMVKTELNELLNSLSNTSYETQEVAESIHSSYTESRNRIFRDSMVLVEPDINPGIRSSAQSGDEPLGKYLRDLDLLYRKSDSPSVEFRNIRSSSVKKSDNLYVKVYFTSLFKGQSTISEQAYSMTHRIAEIKAVKDRNQWRLFIVRLAFFNPADTAGDVANNIPLKHELQSAAEEQSEQVTQQLQEQEKINDERFKQLLVSGDAAYQQKDFSAALKNFLEAQDLRPNSPEVNVRLKYTTNAMNDAKLEAAQQYPALIEKARMLENNRQYKEAIESYQNAIRLKPEEAANLQPHIRQLTDRFAVLSDLQEKYNAGFVKEALKEYTEAIRKDPNNSDYYLGRARCHERLSDESKNVAQALSDYSKAYDLDHNNLSALRYRAELHARTGDYFKALSDYKVYLTIDPKNIPMYERKSVMHVNLRLYPDALADLDEALAIDPKASHVYLAKGILLLFYNKGGDMRQDVQKASDNFTTCLKLDSMNALALFNRGRCDILLGKPVEAAKDFGNARSKGLDTASSGIISVFAANFFNIAVAHFSKKNMDSAIRNIDYAIAIEPASPIYRFTRGEYCYALGDHKEAIASYDLAILYKANYLQAFYKRGLAWYGLGDYKEAMSNFEAVLKLEPQNLFAMKGKGDALRGQKDYKQAVDVYEAAIRIAGNTKLPNGSTVETELYNHLGYCYFQLGAYDRTISDEKKAISNDRNFADAYFNRGYAYYRMGQLSDAIEDLNKAISLLDRHPDWHYVLGRAYLDKKEFAQAAAQFAVYVDTTQPSYLMDMGLVYLNTGKYDSAYYYCQKAWQRDSTNAWASYSIGSSLALQGKADESLVWFERSFQKKTPSYGEIKRDRLLGDNIRNNKKFKDLLKKYF